MIFYFYSQGPSKHDGPPRYSIINFAKMDQTHYDWKSVGTYYDGYIVDVDSEFTEEYEQKGRGECKREECRGNEIKIPDTEDQCCWHCKDCGDDKIKISEYECKECEEGMRSVKNDNDTSYHCVLIEAVSIFDDFLTSYFKGHFTKECSNKGCELQNFPGILK